MSCLGVYSFNDVAVYVDNVLVEGFWEGDDAVIVEPNSDIATAIVGADGKALISVSADRAASITLKLQPNSEMHKRLLRKFDELRSGQFLPFSMSVTDTRNGEGGSSVECVAMTKPSDQFGVQASVREWKIFAGCWEPNKLNYT